LMASFFFLEFIFFLLQLYPFPFIVFLFTYFPKPLLAITLK
jgi:hypothetical protein